MIRRALLLFALLISALLGGCKAEFFQPIHTEDGVKSLLDKRPMPYSFACAFDSEQNREAVRKGFAYWDNMTKRDLFIEIPRCDAVNPKEGEGILIRQMSRTDADSTDKWVVLGRVERYTQADGLTGADLMLMPEWSEEAFSKDYLAVPRHEVGHILGFNHFPQKRCLMYSKVDAYEGTVPPEDGFVKEACPEELELFHAYYGN